MKDGEHPAEAVWVKEHPGLDTAHVVWPAVAVLGHGDLHVHLPDELRAKIDRDGGTFMIRVHRTAS